METLLEEDSMQAKKQCQCNYSPVEMRARGEDSHGWHAQSAVEVRDVGVRQVLRNRS